MEAIRKVLIVDKSIDRKKRIAALKGRGLSVFPALQLREARSRCRPGAYDLIIVNAQDEPEAAAAFCDELCGRAPAQAVLLAVADETKGPDRIYIVADDPQVLAQRAAELLDAVGKLVDASERGNQDHTSARISA
jgi:DNA-binding response OmpR family regulator